MNRKQQKARWAKLVPEHAKRKKGDKFWNKPHISDGGHNMKTGFLTDEVLNRKKGKLKSGYVWSVKKQKYVRGKK